MAQGKMKVKATNMKNVGSKNQRNKIGMKKGGKYIAPKKKVRVNEQKLKLKLQRSINSNIEADLVQKAGASSLSLVKSAAAGTSKEDKKVKTKEKKTGSK